MSILLRQSTATTIVLGPFLDDTDGVTPETALTIARGDVLLWKQGGTTFAQKTETTSATHRSNGMYTVPLDATDTNTLGQLVVSVSDGGAAAACPVWQTYEVVSANVWDSLFSTDKLQVDAVEWLGGTIATPTATGVPEVDVTHWIGTAAATPTTAGVPEVDITHIAGAAVSATTAQLGVNVVQISADATAADNLELFMDGTGYAGGTTPLQVVLTTNGVAAVADGVWDEDITGHRAANAAGAMVQPLHSGACQAGGNTTTVVLASSASSTDDYYNGDLIVGWVTADGTNKFADYISDYVGATRTATVTGIPVSPGATYTYVVLPGGTIPGASAPTASEVADAVWDETLAGHTTEATYGALMQSLQLHVGTAQAGAASTITLDAAASATNDLYNYNLISIRSGTGAGQVRQITDYVGSSKIATVNIAWTVQPDNTSEYVILPGGLDAATVAAIADAVWDEARSGHAAAGSFGEYTFADAIRISGDATAADNLEAGYDGAGYAGGTIKPLVQLADTTHGGSAATLTLKRAVVANTTNGETAVDISASGTGNAHALNIVATGAGKGVAIGAASVGLSIDSSAADAVQIQGGTDSDGLQISGNGSGVDIRADITGTVSGSVGSVTGAVGSVTAGVTLTNAGIDALFTRQLTESYAADGAAPTVAQALMLIQQSIGDFSISGTTLTVKKLDGSTTAATFTLNDGSAPTGVTRAG